MAIFSVSGRDADGRAVYLTKFGQFNPHARYAVYFLSDAEARAAAILAPVADDVAVHAHSFRPDLAAFAKAALIGLSVALLSLGLVLAAS